MSSTRMQALGLLLALLIGAACAGRQALGAATEVGPDIRAARLQWNAALVARDSGALAKLVEDSAVHVSPQFIHVGRVAFLAQFLRAMTTRPQFHLTYLVEAVTVCERPSCAVATEYGSWTESWLQEGEPTEISGTYYAIWRRNERGWQIRSEVFATTRCRGTRYCGS